MKRRNLIRNSAIGVIAICFLVLFSCKETNKEKTENTKTIAESAEPFFKLSLAQWSINKMIRKDSIDPYTFAEKAKNWGFTGLEYVSQLYPADLEDNEYSPEAMANFVEKCNAEAKKHGMQNVLIMIDGQGNLAVDDANERQQAVERHFKWVDAAAEMGCKAIRVNLAGSNQPEQWKKNSVDGLSKLATYAKTKNINVIVENHGGYSSNAKWLSDVIKAVNLPNCGTLPDFGNFYSYNRYKGVAKMMPYAKGVSAKSHRFNELGDEKETNYFKMLEIVKNAGYRDYIGIEYEGDDDDEFAGISATKKLLIKAGEKMS